MSNLACICYVIQLIIQDDVPRENMTNYQMTFLVSVKDLSKCHIKTATGIQTDLVVMLTN